MFLHNNPAFTEQMNLQILYSQAWNKFNTIMYPPSDEWTTWFLWLPLFKMWIWQLSFKTINYTVCLTLPKITFK